MTAKRWACIDVTHDALAHMDVLINSGLTLEGSLVSDSDNTARLIFSGDILPEKCGDGRMYFVTVMVASRKISSEYIHTLAGFKVGECIWHEPQPPDLKI